jgi:hypothetical protein
MKNITDNLAAELGLDSTTLCRLWKITVKLPGASSAVKTIRVTDHDEDVFFAEESDPS